MLNKYGTPFYSQTQMYKDLYKNKEFVARKQQRDYETKKKNGTFNISKFELEVFELLKQK